MDTSSEPNCDAKSLDWALFVLTIISTHVTWWLLTLPTLFRQGFRVYIHDVAWECLRLQVPSFIAFKSCTKQDRRNWQMCYYSGISKPITRLSELKAYVKDSFIVVSTVLALYRLGKGGNADKDLSGLNVTLWNYPSLPIAMIGLGISVFSRTQVRPWIVATVTLAAILIVAAAIAVYIALTYGHGIWIGSTVLILYMALPLWALAPKFIVLSGALATIARIGGPIFGALSPKAYFPFCALRGWAFAGPLLGLGIVNCALALYGISLSPRVEIPTSSPIAAEIAEKF